MSIMRYPGLESHVNVTVAQLCDKAPWVNAHSYPFLKLPRQQAGRRIDEPVT